MPRKKKKASVPDNSAPETTPGGVMPRAIIDGNRLLCGRCKTNEIGNIGSGPAHDLAMSGSLSIICQPCANAPRLHL